MKTEPKLFNIDCMDLLRNTPDGFYELAIVDNLLINKMR